jgi:YgiT-type zinc finger domain-containing protein
MKCIFCGGELKEDITPHHLDHKGYHLHIDAIPVWRCNNCDEIYIESDEIRDIVDLAKEIQKRVLYLTQKRLKKGEAYVRSKN